MFRTYSEIKNLVKRDIKANCIPIGACFFAILLLSTVFGDVCLVKIISGIPCPACGMTRAGIAVLQLHFAKAMQFHPMIPFVYIGGILFIIKKYIVVNDCKWMRYYVIIFFIGVIAVYICRMYTMYPDITPMNRREDCVLQYVKQIFIRQ